MNSENILFWSLPADRVLLQLNSSTDGLSDSPGETLRDREAKQRLVKYDANSLKQQRKSIAIGLFMNQFKSPIVLILMFAAGLSIFLRDRTDAIVILTIVLASGLL
jgi:P-type Mg2+ transporter